MTDKQPLIGGQPSAPPPPYSTPQAPPYPTGGSAAYPPPAYPSGAPPPPLAPYGAATTTNITVVQARPVGARVVVEAKPANYVLLSVIVLVVFCWVFGLIGLIVGIQVDSAWASGDRDGARRLSAAARGWNIAGMIFGGVVWVLVVVSAVSGSAVS